MKIRNRRRTLFVSKIQYHLVIAGMGLVISASVVLVMAFFILLKNGFQLLPWEPIIGDTLNSVLSQSLLNLVIVALVVYLMSLWALVLISHKVYGPIYRFGKYVKKLTEGEKTDELRFRMGDAIDGLKDIYDDLRQALEKTLHYDYKEMASIFAELQDLLDKIHEKKIKNEELAAKLQTLCNRIADALDITSEVVEKN